MASPLATLTATAVSIGFIHTVLGPDHYLPFIVMSRARNWSLLRTVVVTVLCGVGHVGSSVVLGLIGIALGIAVSNLEAFESTRGDLAAWGLIAFGLAYMVWGVRRMIKNTPHTHHHPHGADTHAHEHAHSGDHSHVHAEEATDLTPWVLFTVFVFGPCEPLIPILMFPAAERSLWGVCLVTCAFSAATIGTMLAIVVAASMGLRPLAVSRLTRYSHVLAGATILTCGLAVKLSL